MVVDQTGTLTAVKRHDYLPFGEELFAGVGGRTTGQGYSVSDGVRQKFTSKERDVETGLDYFGARYYASTQGRFTSTDPAYFQKTMLIDPQRFNLYAYVRNNPLKLIDPSGMIAHVSINGNPDGAKEWFRTLAGDLADRLAFDAVKDKQGNILYYNVTFDATAKEIGNNEGAKLVADLVNSDKVFLAQADGKIGVIPLGGKDKDKTIVLDVDKIGSGNVTRNRSDSVYKPADPSVDSIIHISTKIVYLSNVNDEVVHPIRFFIHEAAESYLLVQGIPYSTAHGLYYSVPDRHGVFSYYPIDPRNAITREEIIRDQLHLQGPPAGFYRQSPPGMDVRKQ